jgi:predicted fused transcriptional regulator/phosphomethylpyrimidine kinase
LANIAQQAKAALKAALEVVTDRGYYGGEQIVAVIAPEPKAFAELLHHGPVGAGYSCA